MRKIGRIRVKSRFEIQDLLKGSSKNSISHAVGLEGFISFPLACHALRMGGNRPAKPTAWNEVLKEIIEFLELP